MAHIDETTARIAWEGIHMADYKPGQATQEWHSMCAPALKAAAEATERAPERRDEIERIYNRFADRAASYINERNRIDATCPSVLIVGAGNFPTRKKQKQNARMNSFYQKDWGFDAMLRKLRLIGTAHEPIKSSDDNAIYKLKSKLEKLEADQGLMKAANRAIRMKSIDKGDEKLRELGYTEEQIKNLREGDFCGRVGYPPYALQNNNANIRRIKKRIADIEAEKEAASTGSREYDATICNEPCTIIENAASMRLQVLFDGKPNDECREALKRNGFRWAPSQGVWQRQLNDNARYALNRIKDAA